MSDPDRATPGSDPDRTPPGSDPDRTTPGSAPAGQAGAPPLRAKESYGEDLELVPVRLIGGFVCVDTHLGCVGCGFCLNRRYPAQRRVLEARSHRAWADAGWPPARVARLVAQLPAVTLARVPIRFGHASDLFFQADGAVALLDALPRDRAALLLTRFPVAPAVVRAVAAHPGAVVHLSVAPPVGDGIGCAADVLRSLTAAAAVPPGQLFVLFGPLVAGCEPAVVRLMSQVPPGAAVGFKPLSADGLPFETDARPLTPAGLAALASAARARGLQALPMVGCRLHGRIGAPFFRHPEVAATAPDACATCPNLAVCQAVPSPADAVLAREAAAIGLQVAAIRREPGWVLLQVDAPAARADEVYLSERLGRPVRLSTVPRDPGFRVVQLPDAIFDRWERHGLYPTAEMRGAATRMRALIGL